MVVVFVFLAMFVIIFLTMLSLTLFRIEKNIKSALLVAERKIVRNYGKKQA